MLRSRAVSSGIPPHPRLAFLLLVSIVVGGCAPRTLNTDQLEGRLGRQLSERLGVAGIVTRCPDGVEVGERATFECTAKAPGEDVGIRIVVTQLDDDGHVSWEISGAAG
jgi:Domain of unknown function (DUF4333)